MRTCLLLLLLTLLSSCQSLQRLGRVSPLAGDVAKERVNLWPFYYKNGEAIAVLWPIYDQDEQGFALRPFVTKDGTDWELLPPIGWWNTESKSWVFVPAYRFGDTYGLFPVMGFGDFNYVGPVWWNEDDADETKSFGLFPLVTIGPGLNWATLAWWDKGADGKVESYGLFPIAASGERFHQIGPVFWGRNEAGDQEYFVAFPLFGYGRLEDGREANWAGPVWWLDDEEDGQQSWGVFPLATHLGDFHQVGPVVWADDDAGDTDYLVAFPLFGYWHRADGGAVMLSLLGAKGWDAEGETKFVNVLGPVYHHQVSAEGAETHVLWPFVKWSEETTESSWRLWPLIGRTETKATDEAGARARTWGLAGLIQSSRGEKLDSFRVAPLFSYVSEDAGGRGFFDWISLVGYERHDAERTSLHLGTPLVFNYHDEGVGTSWNALLRIFDYESDGTDSRFNLLYYLYRRQTIGTETRRDLFPFITWDSGEEHSKFSFLWRLIHYERNGDQKGGHFLFIPWGTTDS